MFLETMNTVDLNTYAYEKWFYNENFEIWWKCKNKI